MISMRNGFRQKKGMKTLKIEIEISDEELKAIVSDKISEKIARNMYDGWLEGRVYRKDIKEIVREVIKADIDNLSDRAVAAAAKSIENRSLKKIADSLVKAE